MRHAFVIAVTLILLTSNFASARGQAAFPCYWVHGRLMAYNGTPTFRLWPSGSKRLLGIVCEKRGCGEPEEVLPSSLHKYGPTFGRSMWGDFRVCPLEPERKGWMRMVKMTDARNIAVVDYTGVS